MINFKKILASIAEIFAKQYWLSENFNFQCIFHTFTFMSSTKRLVSKKYHKHSVIIHFVRLLRCETVKIWKIHWKLNYSESQYCFANISAMEALIFMIFFVVVNYYLVSLSLKFHEDPSFHCGDICKTILTFWKIFNVLKLQRIIYK